MSELVGQCVAGVGVLVRTQGGVKAAAATLTANKDAAIAEVVYVRPPLCVCVPVAHGS